MPELKMETGVNVFWYVDLEKLVKEVYGQDISITDNIADERISQNSYMEFTVDGESELDSVGDDCIVEEWIKTGDNFMLDMSEYAEFNYSGGEHQNVEPNHILHRLHKDGIIPSGKYLMTVWW